MHRKHRFLYQNDLVTISLLILKRSLNSLRLVSSMGTSNALGKRWKHVSRRAIHANQRIKAGKAPCCAHDLHLLLRQKLCQCARLRQTVCWPSQGSARSVLGTARQRPHFQEQYAVKWRLMRGQAERQGVSTVSVKGCHCGPGSPLPAREYAPRR
jgi:hypothetical protein